MNLESFNYLLSLVLFFVTFVVHLHFLFYVLIRLFVKDDDS